MDIISLSITPNRRPPGIATFFNPIDMALLSAVKAGIFVIQAAGNTGPSPKSMSSFSPWIFTVGAAAHDRIYSNSIFLGNNVTIAGVGLARKLDFRSTICLNALQDVHHRLNITSLCFDEKNLIDPTKIVEIILLLSLDVCTSYCIIFSSFLNYKKMLSSCIISTPTVIS